MEVGGRTSIVVAKMIFSLASNSDDLRSVIAINQVLTISQSHPVNRLAGQSGARSVNPS